MVMPKTKLIYPDHRLPPRPIEAAAPRSLEPIVRAKWPILKLPFIELDIPIVFPPGEEIVLHRDCGALGAAGAGAVVEMPAVAKVAIDDFA